MGDVSRRVFLKAGSGSVAGTALLCGITGGALAEPAVPSAPGSTPRPNFPHQDPALVAEVVAKSHFDENGVRELVTAHPPLVNAWWDWGFGDWESPLGAASHTGRRAIAEFLIERGARIDIFAAAMLGYTEIVRAFVAARPGVQRTLGPHCIPLLAHAKVGGEKAKDTFDYLKSLGDAGDSPEIVQLEESEKKKYVGSYAFGAGENDRITISIDDKSNLLFQRRGDASRIRIHARGNGEFFPAGAPTTKLTFDLAVSPATMSVSAGPMQLVASRTLGP